MIRINTTLSGVAFTLMLAGTAHAQVTPPATPPATPPVAQRDTPAVVVDSTPKSFPELRTGSPTSSFASGTWSWDALALQREGAITIGELLRRIPGLLSVVSGGYGQPQAATAFGLTKGRIQVELDGYVLDPMMSSIYDLSQVELVTLVGLTVERRLDLIKLKLATAQPNSNSPYTRVEAATGQPDVNAFRAIFLVPKVIVGPLGLALDRLSTNGVNAEAAESLTGWAKWSWTNGARGLQLEFRRQTQKRQGNSPWLSDGTRDDVILRARSQLMTGLTAELFGGSSRINMEPGAENDALPDSLKESPFKRAHFQAGGRASFVTGGAFAHAALRIRDADALPSQELEAGAGYDMSMLHVAGDFAQQAYKDGPGANTYDVRAAVGPLAGLGAFVEVASGGRGAPLYADSADISTREDHEVRERKAMRAGLTLERFGVTGGAAYVKLDADNTAPFGLPFDSAFGGSLVNPATGVEMWGRIGLFRNRFALDASYTYWSDVGGWAYLPQRQWRIAGEVHLSPLPSNNLEIFGRLESMYRGSMLAYGTGTTAEGDSIDSQLTSLPTNGQINGYLQIRVIDVRAFIQWEDMLGKGRQEVPGRVINGPRVFYGVKWQLFN